MKPISRRKLLSQASYLGSTLAVGLPLAGTPRDLLAREPAEAAHKLKVIVTGGHPGDPEYGCGGTVARYTDLGHAVVLLLPESR